MKYKEIGEYLEKTWGVTEFWTNGKRIMKTVEGTWISIKE